MEERDFIADRDLNARIAEEVLGLEVCRNKKGGWSLGPQDWYDDHGAMELFNPLPDYCGDIQDAWKVVESFNRFTVNRMEMPTKYRADVVFHLGQGNFEEYNAEADTAPMAICLAALKAIEGLS